MRSSPVYLFYQNFYIMTTPIRIVHTADNHIGMKFNNYPPAVKEQLIEERFLALQRIVQKGNEAKAHFLVVAGDLFDNLNVPQRDVKRVVDIFSKFEQEVLVLPGNHDFYENTNGSFWDKFRQFAGKNIHLLCEYEQMEFEISERKIIFFPACCRSKHSAENMIGWVSDSHIEKGNFNIGIAHGNVEGLGLGGDQYFNMTPEELISAGLDCWLLGHIHAPYPAQVLSKNPGFFFSATHTPDGFDNKRDGYCWFLEFDEEKNVKMEQWKSGAMKFYEFAFEITAEEDIEAFLNEMDALDKAKSLVRVKLTGRLNGETLDSLNKKCSELKELMLYFEVQEMAIRLNIDKDYINSNYTENSLPHHLLTQLAQDDDLTLQLANQLIEEVKK